MAWKSDQIVFTCRNQFNQVETTLEGGKGGAAISVQIRGIGEAFGGGGGGYGANAAGGFPAGGGTLVGGTGGYLPTSGTSVAGTDAVPNTGSGGGGSNLYAGGNGSAGIVIFRMLQVWTDPGSTAPFNPASQTASSLEAYSLYSTCSIGSFQNESSVGGMQQCPPCPRVGECTFEQVLSFLFIYSHSLTIG